MGFLFPDENVLIDAGSDVQEYVMRLAVVEGAGEPEILGTYGDEGLEPGEVFEFDETWELGGGDFKECIIVLLNETP